MRNKRTGLTFFVGLIVSQAAPAGEILDAPFTKQVSEREKAAIQAVYCRTDTGNASVGTGVHIGHGLILWAQHSRQNCVDKGRLAGFGWSDMTLLACNGALDFCVSRLDAFKPNSKLAANFVPIALARPTVNQRLRAVGHPAGATSIRASEGPVLAYLGINTSNDDKVGAYTFQSTWSVGVSNLRGNSNSPAMDPQGRLVLFMNASNMENHRYSLAELRQNPRKASFGIEGAAIAQRLWAMPSVQASLCRTAEQVYGCR